jgi:pimeloyl-ACP methyl ester carboxylesterase
MSTPPDGSTHEATVEGRTGAAVTGQGGHFAAWEQPDLFAAEMRDAFRTLR